mmetsp:Transcript_4406/g.9366  ORF Transcript_4406/g.9366 Transcript_4406/m.9366 type:complete len:377 (-) Transcript_4406:70-1200(-)
MSGFSGVRDSIQIGGQSGTYIARKSLPDNSELGRTTATERTIATTDSVSGPIAADGDAAEECGGRAQDASVPPPTRLKSILKCKTNEESLKVEYESSTRRQLRLKREELRRKKSLRNSMSRRLSKVKGGSNKRDEDSIRQESVGNRHQSSVGSRSSKSLSHFGSITISETATDRSRGIMKSVGSLFSGGSKNKPLGSSRSQSSLFSHGSKSIPEHGTGDDNEANEDHAATAAVSWDWLEIREYAPEVGANPSVTQGAAVTLSWDYVASDRVQVEIYENLRPPRRILEEMRLPAKEREERLLASGVTKSEIKAAIKNINIAKGKRKQTVEELRTVSVQERVEGAKKKILKIVGKRKSHKDEEEDLWENAQCYFGASA